MTVYVFDLDGTLCTNTNGEYEKAEPYQQRIDEVNRLYDEKHIIKIYTARGMGRNSDNGLKASKDFMQLTMQQLAFWGVKYHELFMGKPSGDIYVDDKGVNDDQWFRDEISLERLGLREVDSEQ